MSTLYPRLTVAVFVSLMSLAASASAEWSSNPLQNLPIANKSGDQVQPKIAITSDGGCYVSWFDNYAGGYDVYLQRLDRWGNELWPHNGILIADRSYDWTMDYDLAVDAGDNAILVYNDDRSGTSQIGCNKISPDGTLLWGPLGVQLTNTEDFVATPSCAVTSDGYYVFGWTSNDDFIVQKLDADGKLLWGPAGLRQVAGTGSYMLSDLVPSDGGAVIALWVRPVGVWYSDKHLYTQKFSPSGAPLWGPTPVIVYDGGSVQNGYFPSCVSDGAGGAVYGWYEVSGSRNAYVQRVNQIGAQLFPHNGVAASTLGTHIRLTPEVTYSAATGDIFLFWVESDWDQTVWGLYGQKFTGGVRQWTDSGRVLIPLGTKQMYAIQTLPIADGALVFCFDGSASDPLLAMRLDGQGAFVWPGSPIQPSSAVSDKWDLVAKMTAGDVALLAWADPRTDGGDIYAQNVNPNGTLGLPPICRGDSNCDGGINWRDIDFFVAAMTSEEAWEAMFSPGLPGCRFAGNDVNNDGTVSWRDIDPFVALMGTTCP